MPIPKRHLKQLRDDLEGHKNVLAGLQTSIRNMQEEAKVHAIILELASDDQIISEFEQLIESPGLLEELRAAPLRYIKSRGIRLPKGVAVRVDGSGRASEVVILVTQGRYCHRIVWSARAGWQGSTFDPAVEN